MALSAFDADPIQVLVGQLARLPGIGQRSAARLAYYILRTSHEDGSFAHELSAALIAAVEGTRFCTQCLNLSHQELCPICSDSRRDAALLCVVEGIAELRAVEQSAAFRGTFHVLHGRLSPIDGVGPERLRIAELLRRPAREAILALSPTVDGDATALYLTRLLKDRGVAVSRLAVGIPMGAEIELLDAATMRRALEERRAV